MQLLRGTERRVPAITRQPIERPIFITGLPRSAMTFLHRLIMADRVQSRAAGVADGNSPIRRGTAPTGGWRG